MATKKEMIDVIAKNVGTSQKNVREILEAYKDYVYSEVRQGNEVPLFSGMILGIKVIPERYYPDLQNGGQVLHPQHYGYKVRFGKEAKDAMNILNGK